MKLEFSLQIFEKLLKYQFSLKKIVHWDPSCSMRTNSRPAGRTDRHVKLIVAFRNFVNAPKTGFTNKEKIKKEKGSAHKEVNSWK